MRLLELSPADRAELRELDPAAAVTWLIAKHPEGDRDAPDDLRRWLGGVRLVTR